MNQKRVERVAENWTIKHLHLLDTGQKIQNKEGSNLPKQTKQRREQEKGGTSFGCEHEYMQA